MDEIYHAFERLNPATVREALENLRNSDWQFTPPEGRDVMLRTVIGRGIPPCPELLCDFRCGGYRILGDVLMDLNEQYETRAAQKHKGIRKGDTAQMKAMMRGAVDSPDYRQTLIRNCRQIIEPPLLYEPGQARLLIAWEDVVKCAEALGKRSFILEVLPVVALDLVIDRSEPEKEERRESFAERIGRILGLHRVPDV